MTRTSPSFNCLTTSVDPILAEGFPSQDVDATRA